MKKGPDELRADKEEGESESKVTNQIFCRLQHPKKELSYVIKNFVSLSLMQNSNSKHPNIPDGNFNLFHHFFCMQIFHINEKRAK